MGIPIRQEQLTFLARATTRVAPGTYVFYPGWILSGLESQRVSASSRKTSAWPVVAGTGFEPATPGV